MSKTRNTLSTMLYGLVFFGLCGGLIFLMLPGIKLAWESPEWPHVDGVVTASFVEREGKYQSPHVEYEYTIAGTRYTSRRISIAAFGDSQRGLAEGVVAQYPVQRPVVVYHRPTDPATSVLEPGFNSDFVFPFLYGMAFAVGACSCLWRVVQGTAGDPDAPARFTPGRRLFGTVFITGLVYVLTILAVLAPGSDMFNIKAFGARPLGLPIRWFVWGLFTVVYLPMPWVTWHTMRLVFHATETGMHPKHMSLTDSSESPELNDSRKALRGGLYYVGGLLVVWLIYTTVRGI